MQGPRPPRGGGLPARDEVHRSSPSRSLFVVTCALTGYYYVTFSRMIDARLHGERDRVLPRVFARPLEIRRGDNVSQKELLDRLNDLGYAQRTQAQNPGEFAVDGALVSVVPRAGTHAGKTLVISFQRAAGAAAPGRAHPPCRRSAIESSRCRSASRRCRASRWTRRC